MHTFSSEQLQHSFVGSIWVRKNNDLAAQARNFLDSEYVYRVTVNNTSKLSPHSGYCHAGTLFSGVLKNCDLQSLVNCTASSQQGTTRAEQSRP